MMHDHQYCNPSPPQRRLSRTQKLRRRCLDEVFADRQQVKRRDLRHTLADSEKPDAGKSLQFSSSPCSLNNYLHRVCTKKPQLLSPALLCNREAKKCPHWCEQQRRRVESAVPASQGKRHRIKVPNDPTKRDGRERGQRTQWPSLTISCSQVPISPPCFSNCDPIDTFLRMLVQIGAPNRIKLKIQNVLSRTGATKPSGDRSSFLTCRPQCRT